MDPSLDGYGGVKSVKVGDLVTVLPAECSLYLVVDFLRAADIPAAQDELGSLWALYGEDIAGIGKMHEKWIRVINES